MSENDTMSPGSVLNLSGSVNPPSEPENERHSTEPVDSNVDNAAVLEVSISGDTQANNSDLTLPPDQYEGHIGGLLDQSGQLDRVRNPRRKRNQTTSSLLVPSSYALSIRPKLYRKNLCSLSPTVDRAKPNALIAGAPLRDRPARPPYPEYLSSRERNVLSSTTSNSSAGEPSNVVGNSTTSFMAGNLFRKKKTNGHDRT